MSDNKKLAVKESKVIDGNTHEINGVTYFKFDFTGNGQITYPLSQDGQVFGYCRLTLDWKKAKAQPFIDAFSFAFKHTADIEANDSLREREVTNSTSALSGLARALITKVEMAEELDGDFQEIETAKWKNDLPEEWFATGITKFFKGIKFQPYFEKGITRLQSFLKRQKTDTIKFYAVIPSGLEHDYAFFIEMAVPSKDARRNYDETVNRTYDEVDGTKIVQIRQTDFGYKIKTAKKYLVNMYPVLIDGQPCDFDNETDKQTLKLYFPPIWFGRFADTFMDYFDIEGK